MKKQGIGMDFEMIFDVVRNFDNIYEGLVGIMMMAIFMTFLVEDTVGLVPKRTGLAMLKMPAAKVTLQWFGIVMIASSVAWFLTPIMYSLYPSDKAIWWYGTPRLAMELALDLLLMPWLLWSFVYVGSKLGYKAKLDN